MNPALISRIAKQRFILKMSEDDFRDRVVRPVFLLKGLKDGRDLCGPTEQGKDALFYDHDRLGNLELTAIQTKAGTVNLAAKASHNLVNLVAQLRTAAGTTYALLQPIRVKSKATKTYLVVSGKINESARKHLVTEVNDTNLHFIDIDDLIPWIDEVMPQLWFDIDSNVSAYYIALEKQLLGADGSFARQFLQAGTIVHESCFGNDAISVYVRKDRDTYSQKSKQGNKKSEATFPLHALTSKPFKRILLVGDGGGGKTTGLLQIVYRAARDGLERGTQTVIPVLVKANDIAEAKPSDLCTYLADLLQQLTPLKKPVFSLSDLNAGHVHLFVDGLDELAQADQRDLVVSLVCQFSDAYPKCQVVISSRPYEFLADLNDLASFERFNVVPINWKDAEKILDLVKAKQAISSEKIKESLQQLSRVQGFTLNPLMVSVYASTSNFEAKDVPPNVTELFKRYTEQMLGRWDEKKGLQNLHLPLIKDFVLSALAFEMHDAKKTKILKTTAEAVIRLKLEDTGHKENAKSILIEIMSRSALFRDYGEEIGFRHHMFQEFFAGRGIPNIAFMAAKCSDAWWRRPIVFYFGDHPRDAYDLESALKLNPSLTPQECFTAHCTIGLSLQACYLSGVTEKIALWKSVVGGLAESLDEYIVVNDPRNETPILTKTGHRLLARDAIALSNIAEQDESIRKWIESAGTNSDGLLDFYLLGLMRIGRFDLIGQSEAKALVKDTSQRLLLLIETMEAELYRPLGSGQKTAAKALHQLATTGSNSLFKIVLKELEIQIEKMQLVQQHVSQLTAPKLKDNILVNRED
jgi:hypothetical protein